MVFVMVLLMVQSMVLMMVFYLAHLMGIVMVFLKEQL